MIIKKKDKSSSKKTMSERCRWCIALTMFVTQSPKLTYLNIWHVVEKLRISIHEYHKIPDLMILTYVYVSSFAPYIIKKLTWFVSWNCQISLQSDIVNISIPFFYKYLVIRTKYNQNQIQQNEQINASPTDIYNKRQIYTNINE